jgi:hypothetical protein
MRRLLRLLRRPARDQWLVLEAAVTLTVAGLSLRLTKFARLAPLLGRHMTESPTEVAAADAALAARVRWAIEGTAAALPWKPVCLPQAVAAKLMLRRRGVDSTLYMGLDPLTYDAHAWLRVGTDIVTGAAEKPRFQALSSFA